MREVADAERIRRFMRAFGAAAEAPTRVYFTGGATAVLLGWRGARRVEPERHERVGPRVLYWKPMPVKPTLPTDLDRRIAGLGDALREASGEVTFAYLFGSASTGALTARSDVDIAIFVAPGADTHVARLAVARAAARQLATDAVDVVLLNGAPLSLVGRVLTTRRVLVDRDPFARHRYESLQARMFQDFRIREHRLLDERQPHG